MQLLKDIYPQYADDVDFYAIGMFPGNDVALFEEFGKKRGYTFPVAVPRSEILESLKVTIQSTKIAFDANGTIIHRHGMGRGNPEIWHEVFAALTKSGGKS